jgi:hypothetical protein
MSLEDAIEHGRTIFEKDRRHPIAREVAAGHIGYKSLNGAADSALSSLMQFGMLEKVAKGEVRVSQWAVDILHPDNPAQRIEAIRSAARNPALFQALDDRFRDAIPSNETLRSYLTRENFNDRAISPIIAAYTKTRAFVTQECANDFSVPRGVEGPSSDGVEDESGASTIFGGARVGDLIQWEVDGVLQMETPLRVRLVTEDGQWRAVEGSETGIPMDQVTVLERASAPLAGAPRFAIETPKPKIEHEAVLAEGWKEERLIDDGGEEIFIRYRGEPTPERYTYIRDYLDFKLSRMKKT